MPEPIALAPLPKHPLISIVIPSFNQGAYIRQTIESCLEQDYRPIEIVVMDGGSTDGTVDILKSYETTSELRWVSERDQGVVDAVNQGLERARGQIVAIQSSDDYYLPGAFSFAVAGFRDHPAAGLVFGDVERVDAEGKVLFTIRQDRFSLARLLAREVFVYQPTAFFRRDLALSLSGWKPQIPYTPDLDLWIRLAFHAGVVKVDAVVGAYRTHPGQRDVERERIYQSYLRMLNDMQELRSAPWALRCAARAGRAMLKFRYGGPWSNAQLTLAAWTALFYKPSIVRSNFFMRHRLVPGYFVLTGLRRRVLGAQRA